MGDVVAALDVVVEWLADFEDYVAEGAVVLVGGGDGLVVCLDFMVEVGGMCDVFDDVVVVTLDADDGAGFADDDEIVYGYVVNVVAGEPVCELMFGVFGLCDGVVEAFFCVVVLAYELLKVGVEGDGACVVFGFDDVDGILCEDE